MEASKSLWLSMLVKLKVKHHLLTKPCIWLKFWRKSKKKLLKSMKKMEMMKSRMNKTKDLFPFEEKRFHRTCHLSKTPFGKLWMDVTEKTVTISQMLLTKLRWKSQMLMKNLFHIFTTCIAGRSSGVWFKKTTWQCYSMFFSLTNKIWNPLLVS